MKHSLEERMDIGRRMYYTRLHIRRLWRFMVLVNT